MIYIPCMPKPKERPRHNGAVTYTPAETKKYERMVRDAYILQRGNQFGAGVPVSVELKFVYPIPKADKNKNLDGKPYPKKADVDNLTKAVFDALNGVAWCDDRQITDTRQRKRYGTRPGVYVVVDVDETQGNDY